MDAEPLPSEALCCAIQSKLQKWSELGEAPEYYALKNRCVWKHASCIMHSTSAPHMLAHTPETRIVIAPLPPAQFL